VSRRASGDKLISYWQIRQIELLLRRIGIPASVDGVRALQGKVGGSRAPYAYRLMSRSQGASFIQTLWEYVRERERDGLAQLDG
jgi:hypothetical protein